MICLIFLKICRKNPLYDNSEHNHIEKIAKFHGIQDIIIHTSKQRFLNITFNNSKINTYPQEIQNNCLAWGVATTIFDPSPTIHRLLQDTFLCLVVVGDKKTNEIPWREFEKQYQFRVFYLSVEHQKKMLFLTVHKLPWNHFGRKNIGYLFAISYGAKIIYDFDDDNTLLKKMTIFHKIIDGIFDQEISIGIHRHHLYNPYPTFHPVNRQNNKEFIWPRGFPLNFIQDPNTSFFQAHDDINASNICIFQSLANNDPDVDAIFRLTRKLPIYFQRENLITAVPIGTYAPWNSQAVLVRDVAFWGLFLPISVDGRVSDIWRGYITSRMLFETQYRIAFTSAFVEQFRNPHDYQLDFENELDLYLKTNKLISILSTFSVKKSYNFSQNLIFLMDELSKNDIVSFEDCQIIRVWVYDLDNLNYKWPVFQNTFVPFVPPPGPIFDFRRFS